MTKRSGQCLWISTCSSGGVHYKFDWCMSILLIGIFSLPLATCFIHPLFLDMPVSTRLVALILLAVLLSARAPTQSPAQDSLGAKIPVIPPTWISGYVAPPLKQASIPSFLYLFIATTSHNRKRANQETWRLDECGSTFFRHKHCQDIDKNKNEATPLCMRLY